MRCRSRHRSTQEGSQLLQHAAGLSRVAAAHEAHVCVRERCTMAPKVY